MTKIWASGTATMTIIVQIGGGRKDHVTNGKGCLVIVMELLDNPANHVKIWAGKPEQWVGLCRQILTLKGIHGNLIYADAKIANCGYDTTDNKLKLLRLWFCCTRSDHSYRATYPPPTTHYLITKGGYVTIKNRSNDKGACQIMSYSMGILGLEVFWQKPGRGPIAYRLTYRKRDPKKTWDDMKSKIYAKTGMYLKKFAHT